MIVYDLFDQERASDASEFGWDGAARVTQVTPCHPQSSRIVNLDQNLEGKG
jgi:hypothetical protein